MASDVFPRCAGTKCDRGLSCIEAQKCLYRSSADEAREVLAQEHKCPTLDEAFGCSICSKGMSVKPTEKEKQFARDVVAVQDFAGKIDGAGVKGVMKDPKCPLEQIPPQFTEGIAEVLKFGMKKYARLNWMRGMSFETVIGGILRHLSAIRRGEEFDPETNLPHAYHAGCGLMFLSWYLHGPNAETYRTAIDSDGNPLDDRVFKNPPLTQK